MPEPHRFTPPWTIHKSTEAYWIEDVTGTRFSYCYFDPSPQRGQAHRPHILTEDDARRLVTNFAKLPDLLASAHEKGPKLTPGPPEL